MDDPVTSTARGPLSGQLREESLCRTSVASARTTLAWCIPSLAPATTVVRRATR